MTTILWEVALAEGTLEWRSPYPDVWVAQAEGQWAGLIEYIDGHFIANKPGQASSRSFHSLLDAKRAVECPETLFDESGSEQRSRVLGRPVRSGTPSSLHRDKFSILAS